MNHKIKAVIAIGGKGTRLNEITKGLPKPLFPVQGISTLERCCQQLSRNNIVDIAVTISYKEDLIINELNIIKEKHNVDFNIFKEEEPLGECGALWHLKEKLDDDFLFINGDLIFSLDLSRLFKFHNDLDSCLTLVTHPSSHPEDSDLVSVVNGSLVDKLFFKEKCNIENASKAFLGNSGISLIKKTILNDIDPPDNIKNSSIFSHLVSKAFNKKIRVFSYNTSEYIHDMGTPNRLNKVEDDIRNNLLDSKSYINRQTALFLDRDNTLIECGEKQYICSLSEMVILKDNILKLSSLSKNFSTIIVVTNQPQVSMGRLTLYELNKIHSTLIYECRKLNLLIDDIIFCPHHPHGGFNDEIKVLKYDCFCRKPKPGMLIEASYYKNIDLSNSLFIGDSERDRECAENAGCDFNFVQDL